MKVMFVFPSHHNYIINTIFSHITMVLLLGEYFALGLKPVEMFS